MSQNIHLAIARRTVPEALLAQRVAADLPHPAYLWPDQETDPVIQLVPQGPEWPETAGSSLISYSWNAVPRYLSTYDYRGNTAWQVFSIIAFNPI